MTFHSFRSGTTEINGVRVDRVLRASTAHMPNLNEDLSHWHWGELEKCGIAWIFAYEEDMSDNTNIMPAWLLNLCLVARETYGCNWVMLDPDGDQIPNLPTFDNK